MPSKYAKPESIDPGPWSARTAETINKLFESIYNATRRAGGSALANQLDILEPTAGDLIVGQTGGVFGLTAFVSTVQRVLTNDGGIPTWAQVSLTAGVTGLLPLANIASFSATKLLWGRNSASAGVAEEVTLSQLLDWITSAAQGDILYRGSSVWKRLGVGATGFFLQSAGAGADLAWAAAGGAAADNIITQMRYEVHGRTTAPASVGISVGVYNAAGGITLSNQPDSSYVQLVQSGTTAGLRAGLDSNTFNHLQPRHDFLWEFVMYTGATMTNLRIWIGLASSGFSDNADTQTTGTNKYFAFRYSTVAGDGGWVGTTNDGATQTVTATVAAIAASTLYKLRIRKSGSTVYFSVNGGAEVSGTLTFPAATTDLGFSAYQYNSINSTTHPWLFGRIRCVYGS